MFDLISSLIDGLTGIVGGSLSNLLMGVAFVVFLAAVINFIWKRAKGGRGYGDDNGLQQAKNMLGWSVIALFVMVSIWGLVAFISRNTGIGVGGAMHRPQTCFSDDCIRQNNPDPSGGGGNNGEELRCNAFTADRSDSARAICLSNNCAWYYLPAPARCGAISQ